MVASQRQLSIVRAQMRNCEREAKLQDLTMEQLHGLGSETRVYRAVGKMFIRESFDDILSIAQSKRDQAQEESKMLSKKCTFYEKESGEAQTHLKDLVNTIASHTGASS
ncbi:unnamed protein product [Malassezia sympodialis ATCC 42132]|nr:uncharacterized protein MSY001_1938 [Malassezia sympodialis ATCC 42132]CCU99232.1 unnamed protein product [Malassezia sympodialis ATCC 42132]|eukprot:XP_018740494.1 uncharacterized protein MSY001_1938 [Malassezia sympodialis ATCC 42132]